MAQVKLDPVTGGAAPYPQMDRAQAGHAIAAYQVTYDEFETGRMR